MLGLLIGILVAMWLLGYAVFHIGDVIHFLLVIAAIVVLVRVIRGRPVV